MCSCTPVSLFKHERSSTSYKGLSSRMQSTSERDKGQRDLGIKSSVMHRGLFSIDLREKSTPGVGIDLRDLGTDSSVSSSDSILGSKYIANCPPILLICHQKG